MPEFTCPICGRAAGLVYPYGIVCETFMDETSNGCVGHHIASDCVALGLSIRRFVRRAEVERLVADVRHETLRHDYHCNNRRTGCGCRGDRAQSALDRLASMAMAGHGDG